MAGGDPNAWRDADLKPRYVQEMFAGVARHYDLLNSLLSLNRHHAWRRAAVREARLARGGRALDVCCGTGDLALELARAAGPTGWVAAGDFCAPMLELARRKVATHRARVSLVQCDAMRMPFADSTFDCAAVGFGIRNVADAGAALTEMMRVTRPGGRVVCLEFAVPANALLRAVTGLYLRHALPRIGGLLSSREAYTYLPRSIEAFHSRESLSALMRQAGLDRIAVTDLMLGGVCIHVGVKP